MNSDPPRSDFHPPCKVCDRGVLIPKKIFRMSRPVVAIGYILLVPSILGMLVSALILFGILSYNSEGESSATKTTSPGESSDDQLRRYCATYVVDFGSPVSGTPASLFPIVALCECQVAAFNSTHSVATASQICSEPNPDRRRKLGLAPIRRTERDVSPIYSETVENFKRAQSPEGRSDDIFRRNCVMSLDSSLVERYGAFPITASQEETSREICECTLSQIKIGVLQEAANRGCQQDLTNGSLAPPDAETNRLYDSLESTGNARNAVHAGIRLFHIIGGGLAIFWLIGSFVAGLLGWLLVMKKRVLKCNVCGATISAS